MRIVACRRRNRKKTETLLLLDGVEEKESVKLKKRRRERDTAEKGASTAVDLRGSRAGRMEAKMEGTARKDAVKLHGVSTQRHAGKETHAHDSEVSGSA